MSGGLRSYATVCFITVILFGAQLVTGANAEEKPWWPVKVTEFSTGKPRDVEYVPLKKASKKWNIVALQPHMKDKTWLAANYGLVMEAKRLGVKLTMWEAGGYTNLAKQLSQYDDAVAMGADAILVGVISEVGVNKKVKEGAAKGIKNVAYINPVSPDSPFDARVGNDVPFMAETAADMAIEYYKDKEKVRTVVFPGPAGSGWAEQFAESFRKRVEEKAPGKFEILDEKYGDTGKSIQLKLVEDAFQAYGDIDLLYGNTPMSEVAINVIEELGRVDKTKILASYESEDLIPGIKAGQIIGMVGEFNVMIARIALDVAVRLLENKPHGFGKYLRPRIGGITKDNVDKIPWNLAFSPPDFRPTYKVD